MSQWGAGTADESKPKEAWIVKNTIGAGNNSANTYATEKGWVFRWPWGEEVIAAIGGLATQLDVPTFVGVIALTTGVSNVAAQNVAFGLTWNEPVVVTGTPSLVAIGAAGAANVTVTYDSALSDPTRGYLVFRNANVDLSSIAPDATITVNATSGGANFTGYANIVDATSTTNIASALTGYTAALTVAEYEPLVNDLDSGAAPAADEDQILTITVGFNTSVVVAGTPTIVALSSNVSLAANATLSYNAAASNTTTGRLVFGSAALDLTGAEAVVFTINASSTLVGITGVTSAASGNAAANSLNGIANTITVAS